uniref:Uncharacterized protein n=1 Tax=Romanomermis culicivorax TaxID=13658 RepID=A0A915IVG2_ROMCU
MSPTIGDSRQQVTTVPTLCTVERALNNPMGKANTETTSCLFILDLRRISTNAKTYLTRESEETEN